MDIVFDQKFPVIGEELPVSLGFENVIFVMEDVDAASPIVHSRDRAKRKRGTKTTLKVPTPQLYTGYRNTLYTRYCVQPSTPSRILRIAQYSQYHIT